MKILHTSDWHLGAKTDRRSRLAEQRKVLNEILSVCDREAVDIVLIAGDVYDQAVPTSEAEDLFFDTLEKLADNGDRVVIVSAGNHDDPKRIMANKYFAKKHNIVLAGDLHPVADVCRGSKAKITCTEHGTVKVEVEGRTQTETAWFGLLPYPTEYRITEKSNAENYSKKVGEWANLVCSDFNKKDFCCVVSHFTAVGAEYEEGGKFRRISINESGVVNLSDLPKADYYALGHLHSAQRLGSHAYYSGAPLKLSYIQKTTSVNLLDVENGKLKSVEQINLVSPNKMQKVCAVGLDAVAEELQYFSTEDIVELTIVQDKPLLSTEINGIKERYPCVQQIKLMLTNMTKDSEIYINNRDKLEPKELFENFYKRVKGVAPSDKIVSLFVELMEETNSEAN